MWYEIFKFEIQYRAKRLETYLYFIILFLFSIVAVDFILQGSFSTAKTNAPHVIAKTMAIVSAIFMMLSSMIMGVAVLRDFEHHMESILFVKPITKGEYLVGRFLGSFVVLILIFSGLLFGMMLGEFMPWKDANDLLPFNSWHYIQPFLYLVLPSLFFGGSVFFVSGALSRKLIVVYTQGICCVHSRHIFSCNLYTYIGYEPWLGRSIFRIFDRSILFHNHRWINPVLDTC